MKKNTFAVAFLSLLLAASLLYDIKLAIGMLLMIAGVILILRSETAFIYVYFIAYLVLSSFANRMSFSLSGNQSINLLGILNISMILFFYFKMRDFLQMKSIHWNKNIIYPVILFSLYLLLTAPFTINLAASIRGLTRILSGFSFYLLTYFVVVKDKNVEKKIFKFITAIFIFLLTYGIVEYVTGFNIFHNRFISNIVYLDAYDHEAIQIYNRIRTTFYHPSVYSFALLIFLPLYLYFYVKKKENKYFYGIIVILFLINIFLTFTRITWIAVFSQMLFFLYLFRPKKIMRFVFPLGVIFILMSGQIIARATTVDSSALGRLKLFQFGLDIFKEHPVFGSGLGTYLELAGIAAHGDYMQMFAETGVFGGFGFLIVLLTMIIFAVKNFKECDFAKVSFLMIIGFMVFGLTDNGLSYSHVFWGLLGICNGIIVRNKLEKHQLELEYNAVVWDRSTRIAVL
ncbi:MAG: O-antigen ligase family protein [Candidatus Loosdrechtia sp.]|uniref:O-antigen ligase family protein n=1 Tax=Candidatus Loosdrechtia sp. TaxID=3101272 RepID=UPI003A7982D7|nr:MAG: O-antigen ligase family protein [Candidatus Jettenia sp. AMX2]